MDVALDAASVVESEGTASSIQLSAAKDAAERQDKETDGVDGGDDGTIGSSHSSTHSSHSSTHSSTHSNLRHSREGAPATEARKRSSARSSGHSSSHSSSGHSADSGAHDDNHHIELPHSDDASGSDSNDSATENSSGENDSHGDGTAVGQVARAAAEGDEGTGSSLPSSEHSDGGAVDEIRAFPSHLDAAHRQRSAKVAPYQLPSHPLGDAGRGEAGDDAYSTPTSESEDSESEESDLLSEMSATEAAEVDAQLRAAGTYRKHSAVQGAQMEQATAAAIAEAGWEDYDSVSDPSEDGLHEPSPPKKEKAGAARSAERVTGASAKKANEKDGRGAEGVRKRPAYAMPTKAASMRLAATPATASKLSATNVGKAQRAPAASAGAK
jgi:hypothetical protein